MNSIRSPSRNQPLRVSTLSAQYVTTAAAHYRRLCVLHDVALDVSPVAITIGGVVLCTQIDSEDTIATKDVGAECRQPSHALVVRGFRDEVCLEEVHARGRQFDHFSQVHADQFVHPSLTHRGVLQDVDGAVVAVVSQHVAKGERVDDANECLACFVERTHCPTRQRLNAVTNLRQRQSRERRGVVRSKLRQHAGVDAVRTVRSCTDQSRQRLAKAIRHFLRDVLDGAVDGCCQRQRREVRVVGVFQMCLG